MITCCWASAAEATRAKASSRPVVAVMTTPRLRVCEWRRPAGSLYLYRLHLLGWRRDVATEPPFTISCGIRCRVCKWIKRDRILAWNWLLALFPHIGLQYLISTILYHFQHCIYCQAWSAYSIDTTVASFSYRSLSKVFKRINAVEFNNF